MTLGAKKQELRARMIEHRAKQPNPEAAARAARAARTAADIFLAEVPYGETDTVAGYWAMRGEIDPVRLLRIFGRAGHGCGLPVVEAKGQPLIFRKWSPFGPTIAGNHGERIPPPSDPLVIPTLVIVPLLAFDRAGYRLGYGGGYYDRTLAALRAERDILAVGYAFARQEVEAVPHDANDARLDWIVTEREAMRVDVVPPPLPA